MPKFFQPSVACPVCCHANDETFNFCQSCGYKRKRIGEQPPRQKKLRFPVKEDEIEQRLVTLQGARECTQYNKQISAKELELNGFLMSLSRPKNVASTRPADIVKCLVWKDKAGRTKVHDAQCTMIGRKGQQNCMYQTRLAFGTVDSMIGKLRTIFAQHDRVGEWDTLLSIGNPANSIIVKRYLSSIKAEQLQARSTPSQAKPFLLPHLEGLIILLHSRLSESGTSPQQIFVFARNQAFCAIFAVE